MSIKTEIVKAFTAFHPGAYVATSRLIPPGTPSAEGQQALSELVDDEVIRVATVSGFQMALLIVDEEPVVISDETDHA
jgi:hypothetical protein